MIYSFAPIIDKDSRILILGSMPSIRSLELGQYYGHGQNYFWPMLFELFGETYSNDYEQKKRLILSHRLALWDVLGSCEREGSLDSNITNEIANDFDVFFKEYPLIKAILFNGTKAEQSFKKYFPQLFQTMTHYKMPSTSPAHTMKRQDKLTQWRLLEQLLAELENEN